MFVTGSIQDKTYRCALSTELPHARVPFVTGANTSGVT